ncbi:uncharacterized protein LACBIDRAFT_310555 [Laccaria bicolor S238N-H82]|uniref:Predicted protein n=1 Tax=Laccaria bicolor (strain S238N-H82 / ATCC MYA-4686) TaxID=486041 RepID=B0DUL2_LACBS|nr:uncharacterized protein LACBIDRAFT_310555 [Laccaria bicolor S238N-H82]EDR01821.1 predicted protein [Laccaria bicolor S238N-H82]|eukprot:XP_001887634.1 predicted protein [Laccaria bicolor S238N-H82]
MSAYNPEGQFFLAKNWPLRFHVMSKCHAKGDPTYLYLTLYPPSNSHTPLPPPLQWPGQPRDLT